MIDKIVASAAEALAGVKDGATVMIGGFGSAGHAERADRRADRAGRRDLTVVNNNAGNGETGLAALLKAGRVRKIICSFPRQADSQVFDGLYRAGKIELELVPQGNLAERIRAAGAGIGALLHARPATARAREGQGDARDRRPQVRARIPDPCRRGADQGRAGRPLGQPGLPQDGAQLRPGDGDGRQEHGREVHEIVELGDARPGDHRHARHLRAARRADRRRLPPKPAAAGRDHDAADPPTQEAAPARRWPRASHATSPKAPT